MQNSILLTSSCISGIISITWLQTTFSNLNMRWQQQVALVRKKKSPFWLNFAIPMVVTKTRDTVTVLLSEKKRSPVFMKVNTNASEWLIVLNVLSEKTWRITTINKSFKSNEVLVWVQQTLLWTLVVEKWEVCARLKLQSAVQRRSHATLQGWHVMFF